jgi:Family of unknown function (DUF6272)
MIERFLMNATEFHEFQRFLDNNKIVFCYNGYLSQQIVMSMSEMLKQKVSDTGPSIAPKIMYIFIEQAQNIVRYSAQKIETDDRSKRLGYGSLAIGIDGEKYFCMCGNLVEKDKARSLQERLEEVRLMDKDTLKAAYKKRLNEGPEEGSDGASIGFIEMARKSSEPIQFEFVAVDDSYEFFYLKVYI